MSKLHLTLTARFNVSLIVAAGIVALILVLLLRPRPVVPVAIGLVSGVVTGALQRISIRRSPAEFARSETALAVRRAFMSNRPGRLSSALLWATGIALLVVALIRASHPFLDFAAGYASFMFAREAVSFGVLVEAQRVDDRSEHTF